MKVGKAGADDKKRKKERAGAESTRSVVGMAGRRTEVYRTHTTRKSKLRDDPYFTTMAGCGRRSEDRDRTDVHIVLENPRYENEDPYD